VSKLEEIKAVVFDMDGLLFDTEQIFFAAMRLAGEEQGHEITYEFFLTLVGLDNQKNYLLMRERFGSDFPAEPFHDLCRDRFFEMLETDLRLKPGVIELIDHIEAIDLPMAIATSSYRENVEHHLAAFDLTDHFDAIVAHGDYAHSKPHPAPYLAAISALGVEPHECLALEDSHNGVRSAAAAGLVTIMVPDLLLPDDEIRSLAFRVVEDLHQVRILFGG
jgi:HAD superfamily hydrolase (TIGR01509 family)